MQHACAAAALLACGLAAACSAEPSRAASELAGSPLEPDSSPLAGAPPLKALALLEQRYAKDYIAEGEAITGELASGERRDFLSVLRYGHCYRVLGAGGAGLTDLDLVLFDQTGVRITQDPGQDPFPVLGLQSSICPETAGAFRVQAHAFAGEGAFAFRVYRTGP